MCAINSFYFMTFYHCIRHAVLLSIVLTLLSSVLSAILYNFNKWMNEQILHTEITDVKSRDGCQESCHAISKVAWSVYKHRHGMWLDSHSCERTSIGLQPRFRWPTAVFMEQRRRTLLGAFSSIWHRHSMSSTFWWHGHAGGSVHQTFNARQACLLSGFGTCVEQPTVVCQACTVADDIPSRTEDCTFQSAFDSD